MLNPKDLKFACTRCGNCCTDRNTLVNVTYLDIGRIINSLNLDLKESLEIFGFYIYDKALNNIILEKMVISPIETEKGLAFIGLMKNNRGECYFYDKKNQKCLIYSLRPLLCKSFPFSFIQLNNNNFITEGRIQIIYTEKAKKYCPGIGNNAPPIDIDYWLELANRTLRELKDNYIFNENWNNIVKNREIIPSAKNFINRIISMVEEQVFNLN
ncbi:MAG: YkgJ family cysteine cluster protein [Candidatus Hodarchaeota archaeon]